MPQDTGSWKAWLRWGQRPSEAWAGHVHHVAQDTGTHALNSRAAVRAGHAVVESPMMAAAARKGEG